MKSQRSPRALSAEAGPRIRAPQRSIRRGLDEPVENGLLDEHLLRSAHSSAEAAEWLLLQLREDALALLPWSLDRRDPVRHLGWVIAAGICLPVILALMGAGSWWIAGPAFLAALGAWRLLNSHARMTAVAAREIQTELEHGTPLREIEDEIERLVRDAPDLDGARLLLAQAKLERGECLAALLQLAPLRDRYPGEGAVVLLAALAYARLGAERDAARMLEALRVEEADAWSASITRFHELCVGARGSGARASSDDHDTEV